MKSIKLLLMGDLVVGKTSLLIVYYEGKLPDEIIEPTWADYYRTNIAVGNQVYRVEILDTSGNEGVYDRYLSYKQTDVVLVVFSVVDPKSFENILTTWIPEVKHYGPNTPIILVGNKTDLRDDPNTLKKLHSKQQTIITTEMGEQLARRINASNYMECSCVDGTGVHNVFKKAVLATFSRRKYKRSPNSLKFVCFGETEISKLVRQFLVKERKDIFGKPLNGFCRFSDDHDDYFTCYEINGEEYTLDIHIASEEDLDIKTSMKNVDLFMGVFSVIHPDSYQAVEQWIAELKKHYPKTPLVLLGSHVELQSTSSTFEHSSEMKQSVTTEIGEQLARDINAALYMECSRNDETQIADLFEEAVWASLRRAEKRQPKKKKRLALKIFGRKIL